MIKLNGIKIKETKNTFEIWGDVNKENVLYDYGKDTIVIENIEIDKSSVFNTLIPVEGLGVNTRPYSIIVLIDANSIEDCSRITLDFGDLKTSKDKKIYEEAIEMFTFDV